MDAEFTILDHIDGIKVPGDVFKEPANEYWALLYLWEGLEFLYRQVKPYDEGIKQLVNPGGESKIFISGNAPALSDVPKGLLTSAFHWYANSAYQYVRTVGAIAHRRESSRPRPDEYLSKVIPEVYSFRDKVAAHFAWATQNSQDNEAERQASIMQQLAFLNDSLQMGGFALAVTRGGKTVSSGNIRPWSLCKTHEQLRIRYWPNT